MGSPIRKSWRPWIRRGWSRSFEAVPAAKFTVEIHNEDKFESLREILTRRLPEKTPNLFEPDQGEFLVKVEWQHIP